MLDGAAVDMSRLACSKISHGTGTSGARTAADASVSATTMKSTPPAPAGSLIVTNCNRGGEGSLDAAVAYARDGETIDMTQLTCGEINIASVGSNRPIAITKRDLTIIGPGADRLALVGSFYAGTAVGTYQSAIFDITAGEGTTTLRGLTLREGLAFGKGGCVAASNSSLSLQGVRVQDCRATADDAAADAHGGGLYVKGDLTLRDSTLTGNTVSGSNHSKGGGTYVGGNAHIENSTIAKNSASGGAGGLSIAGYTAGTSSIVNSTISSNRALSVAGLHSLANMTISNSTIAFNQSSAGTGAGIYVSLGSLALNSVIIANNTAPFAARADLDRYGSVPITGAHNLIVQSTIAPTGTIVLDPKFSPLLNYGGTTPTHALDRSSPAIDHGSNLLNLTSDQRGSGHPRVLGAAPDIGAFEGTDDVIFRNGFDAPG